MTVLATKSDAARDIYSSCQRLLGDLIIPLFWPGELAAVASRLSNSCTGIIGGIALAIECSVVVTADALPLWEPFPDIADYLRTLGHASVVIAIPLCIVFTPSLVVTLLVADRFVPSRRAATRMRVFFLGHVYLLIPTTLWSICSALAATRGASSVITAPKPAWTDSALLDHLSTPQWAWVAGGALVVIWLLALRRARKMVFPDQEVPRCVRCGYPLIGLRDHRCPECGTRF